MNTNVHISLNQYHSTSNQLNINFFHTCEAAIPGWKHPAPFRTWKLSSRGPYQYWARRLPGNVRCCFFLPFPLVSFCLTQKQYGKKAEQDKLDELRLLRLARLASVKYCHPEIVVGYSSFWLSCKCYDDMECIVL